jgi:hypothetical protein
MFVERAHLAVLTLALVCEVPDPYVRPGKQ